MKEAIMAAEFLGIAFLIVLWLKAKVKAEAAEKRMLAERKLYEQEQCSHEYQQLQLNRMIDRISSVIRRTDENVPPKQATKF